MNRNGFTLIELLMTLVIVSIVSVAASVIFFGNKANVSVPALAKKIRDDIRYTQGLAMAGVKLGAAATDAPVLRYRMNFNVPDANCTGASQYTIINDADYNGTWGENPNGAGVVESGRNPSDGSTYFCVKLSTGDYAGLTAVGAFNATVGDARVLEFDRFGVPYNADGRLFTPGTVTVSGGGQSVTLTIAPFTGMVAIQ